MSNTTLTALDFKETIKSISDEAELIFEDNPSSKDIYTKVTFYDVETDEGVKSVRLTKDNLMEIVKNFRIVEIREMTVINIHAMKVAKEKEKEISEKKFQENMKKLEESKGEFETEIEDEDLDDDEDEDEDDVDEEEEEEDGDEHDDDEDEDDGEDE